MSNYVIEVTTTLPNSNVEVYRDITFSEYIANHYIITHSVIIEKTRKELINTVILYFASHDHLQKFIHDPIIQANTKKSETYNKENNIKSSSRIYKIDENKFTRGRIYNND